MKKCTICEKTKPFEDFYKCSRRTDGYASQCKVCADLATKDSRAKRPQHYNKLRGEYKRKRYLQFADWKREQGCTFCDENEPVCLDLHHLNPDEKDFEIGTASGYSWNRIFEEVEKCIVVCKNCHAKLHAGIIKAP